MKTILLITLLYLLPFFSYCQHPYFYDINDENGLPSNEVYITVQDSSGFLWIGCDAGLFKYDGFIFKPYTNKFQNGKAISSLKFDSKGKLWCQNFAGQIYTVENDSLIIYADVRDEIKSPPDFDVDENQNLYIGLPSGILKIKPDHTEELLTNHDYFAQEIKVLANGDFLFYAYGKGLFKSHLNKVEIVDTFTLKSMPTFLSIEVNGDGCYILSGQNNNVIYNLAHFKTSLVHQPEILKNIHDVQFYYMLKCFDQNEFWLTTSNGAYQIDIFDGTIIQHLFPSEKISSVSKDREGNYWFTSLENGIHVVPNIHLSILNKTNSILLDNNITCINPISKNILLIGTYNGSIYKYNIETKVLLELPKSLDLKYRNVTKIISYQHGYVASRHILSYFDSSFSTEKRLTLPFIRDLELVNDSLYYVSSANVAYISDTKNLFAQKDVTPVSITETSGRFVEYDSMNTCLWFGMNDGLYFLEKDSLIQFIVNGFEIYPTALKYSSEILWVGTISDGVYGIKNKKIVYHFSSKNVLRGNSINAIFANDEMLIVATDVCIQIINFVPRAIDYLDYTDGIYTKDINDLTIFEDVLYIGTGKGLYFLPLHSIKSNKVNPTISIEKIWLNKKLQTKNSTIELNYNDELIIEFSSVALRSRGSIAFEYRLKNGSSSWTKLDGNVKEINFSGLPIGTNLFEIYAINEDGVYSKNPASLLIQVNAPFWQKWWFYLLIVFVTISFVAFIYSLRIKSIRRKSLMKEKLIRSQLKTLKAQMNPHFIFNTLNSIQDLILHEDVKNSYHYLNKFSLLMRKVLEASDTDEISLADEKTFLELYLDLEKLRFGKDFNYSISIDQLIDVDSYSLPTLLLQPFVENAIKHGLLHKKGEKNLTIDFKNETHSGKLICTIEDNGVGRKKALEIKNRSARQHQSFATKAIEQRIELLNMRSDAELNIQIIDLEKENVSLGTRVEITLLKLNKNKL